MMEVHRRNRTKENDMRANGTRTPRELANELARIDVELSSVNSALDALTLGHASNGERPVSEATGTAWNALHDAVTALEAEREYVARNSPYADATALLIAQNID